MISNQRRSTNYDQQKKLLKEPLLHFIAIGVVFFLVYGLVNTDVNQDRQILVDQSDVDEIAIILLNLNIQAQTCCSKIY